MDVINGKAPLKPSKNGIDWLGSGIYFWEGDPLRAKEWALERQRQGKIKNPFVIGAVIDLRNCLDLMTRQDIELLKETHALLKADRKKAGLPPLKNQNSKRDKNSDLLMRHLDCAVIDYLHEITAKADRPSELQPFDTVRALFTEGRRIYGTAGFRNKTHSQIAVRKSECISGYFLPLPPLSI
jgi:hypothetical protein